MTLLLPENTAEMLHLLSRETGQNIGDLVQEMALARYMRLALSGSDAAVSSPSEPVLAETIHR
ncbi:hypothetical protein [Pacificibacter marinus]|uniref:hypothetical protein n=1 Tax=Pacificibacter marinus TaxID=658057 RepID=UPI001C073B6A|nr:hypothetical protein [Pacificibacter marinus]MBU2866074.1 hypothetical protein [Pacificibacter marinus]